jgi:hypothetical protein
VVLERKSPDKRGSYKFGPWTSIDEISERASNVMLYVHSIFSQCRQKHCKEACHKLFQQIMIWL